MAGETCESEKPSDDLILCEGVVFVGLEPLAKGDRALLRRQSARFTIKGILWLASIPSLPFAPFIVWGGLKLVTNDRILLNNLVALVAIGALMLGIPVAILRARDCLGRRNIVRQTLKLGSLRTFKGALNINDPTDPSREVLERTRLLNRSPHEINQLDLYATSDAVFQVNRVQPKAWTPISLTLAAAAPINPARFDAPKGWGSHDENIELGRRRLSAAECKELVGYSRSIQRRACVSAVVVGYLGGRALFGLLNKVVSQNPGLGKTLAIAITLGACTLILYRAIRRARMLKADAKNAWAVTVDPTSSSARMLNEVDSVVPIEVLALSTIVWRVQGKPAGWRKARIEPSNKRDPKSPIRN